MPQTFTEADFTAPATGLRFTESDFSAPVKDPAREAKGRALRGELMAARRSGYGADALMAGAGGAEFVVDAASKMITSIPRAGYAVSEMINPTGRPFVDRPTIEKWTPEMAATVRRAIGGPGSTDISGDETAAGVANAVSDFGEFFTTPEGMATLGAGAAPALARAALGAGFSGQMSSHVPEAFAQAGELSAGDDRAEAVRAGLGALGTAVFAGAIPIGAIAHQSTPRVLPPAERAGKMLEAAVNDPALLDRFEQVANDLAIERSSPESAQRGVVSGQRPAPEMFTAADFNPFDRFDKPPSPPETVPSASQPSTPPLSTSPALRGEAAMETRPTAEMGLDRTQPSTLNPELSTDLADTIAALRAGYRPEVETIVAATVQPASGGKVFDAATHAQGFEAMTAEFPGLAPESVIAGFRTSTGRVVSREEAAMIAGMKQRRAESETLPTPATFPAATGATAQKMPVEQMTPEEHAKIYPVVESDAVIDGREIINADEIPNMSSIGSSVDNPKTLPGIREVPMSDFTLTGRHYSIEGQKKIDRLAEQIKESGQITPLIVVRDGEGSYILEGATRADALFNLGAKSFPAKVVLDLDSISEANAKAKPTPAVTGAKGRGKVFQPISVGRKVVSVTSRPDTSTWQVTSFADEYREQPSGHEGYKTLGEALKDVEYVGPENKQTVALGGHSMDAYFEASKQNPGATKAKPDNFIYASPRRPLSGLRVPDAVQSLSYKTKTGGMAGVVEVSRPLTLDEMVSFELAPINRAASDAYWKSVADAVHPGHENIRAGKESSSPIPAAEAKPTPAATGETGIRRGPTGKLIVSELSDAQVSTLADAAGVKKDKATRQKLQELENKGLLDASSIEKPAAEPKPPAATGATAQKMPWEMTRAEYNSARFNFGFQTENLPETARLLREEGQQSKSELNNVFGQNARRERDAVLGPLRAAAKAELDKKFGQGAGKRLTQPHEQQVAQALREGKPVPAEVLADYPDLKPAKLSTPAPAPPAVAKAKESTAQAAPARELPQVSDDVTWKTGAGDMARATVQRISKLPNDAEPMADVDWFGVKRVPVSQLQIVKKSSRRVAEEQRLTAANVPTAAKVTPAQASAAANPKFDFNPKVAKEQKKFLLDAVDKALAEAPDVLPEEIMRQWQASEHYAAQQKLEDYTKANPYPDLPQRHNFGYTDAELAKYEAAKQAWEVERAEWQQRKDAELSVVAEPYMKEMIGGADISAALTAGTEAAFYRSLPHVTIEVPGDGVFSIVNTKDAIRDFKERAAKFPTTAARAKAPGSPRVNPTPVPALGEPTKENVLKAASLAVSTDTSRAVIMNVWSDGKQTVATDGRRMLIFDKGLGGTEKNPVMLDAKGKPAVVDREYPNWKQVRPAEADLTKIFSGQDAAKLWTVLKQADAILDKEAGISKSVKLWWNPDRTLGISSSSADVGAYEHNVQPNAKLVTALKPEFLMDALDAARKTGSEKVDVLWVDELSPVVIRGDHVDAIIMPMRMDGPGPGSFAPEMLNKYDLAKTPAEARAMMEKDLKALEDLRKPTGSDAAKADYLREQLGAVEDLGAEIARLEAKRKKEAAKPRKTNLQKLDQQTIDRGLQARIDALKSKQREAARKAKFDEAEQIRKATEGTPDINTGALGESGMGGAKPGEFAGNSGTPTGIKNATVDAERARRGLPPAMEAARRDWGSVWDEAMARVDMDPALQDRLIAELKAKPRALTDTEGALLAHRQIDLQNEYDRLNRELAVAYEDSKAFPNRLADMEAIKARRAEVSDQLLDVYDVGKLAGTENARGLAFRKAMFNENYTLAAMEMEKRAANGGAPLTDAERSAMGKLHERIVDLEAKAVAREEQVATERASRMTDEAIADMKRELASKPSYDPRIVKIAEEIVTKLEHQADKSRAFLKGKFLSPTPEDIYHLGVIGAAKIARLGLDFGKFSIEMAAEFGDGVKPYLQAAWERANLHLENEGAKYGDKAEPVKRLLRKRDAEGQREGVIEGLKKAQAEGLPVELLGDYVRKLALSFVRGGVTERNALVDAVHKVLTEDIGMELSRRETMDAISGYGRFKPLDADAAKATLRDLKGQMQQLAKLEDITAKKPLQKTGVERRSQSDEERRLIQQVNEAKRRHGVVVTDPARQLKSALDAVRTRLKHQVADLEYQIATKERIVKSKTDAPFDAETKLLETRRDALRAQLDELVPRPGRTDAQLLELAVRNTERSIADYEQRIAGGEMLVKRAKPGITSPELAALKARRDAVRAEWQELRELDGEFQRQQAEAALTRQKSALEEAIAAKEKALAEGPKPPVGREMSRPADPALESLMQKRDALNRQLAEARKKPWEVKHAEQVARQLAAMEKSIAEREAKLAAGDLSTEARAKVARPLADPELEMARQKLDDVNRRLAEARKPKGTPEERALKALHTRLTTSAAEYADRLARGDFAPRVRKPVPTDPTTLRLKAEAERAKVQWREGLERDRFRQLSPTKKAIEHAKEVLNLPRAVLASWDVSAVLRQGGFITLNPMNWRRAASGLAPMFRALASETRAHMVEKSIRDRPNAPLYDRAKLYLASLDTSKLTAMEELFMSRMSRAIPGVRASERAYITFLNKLRADSFDAMVDRMQAKGTPLTDLELQAVGNFVNVSTGRGDMGARAAAADTLATIFFSPRLVVSRFQLLTGQPLRKAGTLRVARAVAAEYAGFLSGLAVVYALANMAGAEVETDPRSSDFGKLRFGNTRVDPLAGLAQVTGLLSRLGTGETKSISGKVKPIVGDLPYGADTAPDVIFRFLRTKLSPVVGAAVDLRQGENVVGEKVSPTTTLQRMAVPLSFQEIYKVMLEDGVAKGTALGILSLFGWGLQQFDDRKPKK